MYISGNNLRLLFWGTESSKTNTKTGAARDESTTATVDHGCASSDGSIVRPIAFNARLSASQVWRLSYLTVRLVQMPWLYNHARVWVESLPSRVISVGALLLWMGSAHAQILVLHSWHSASIFTQFAQSPGLVGLRFCLSFGLSLWPAFEAYCRCGYSGTQLFFGFILAPLLRLDFVILLLLLRWVFQPPARSLSIHTVFLSCKAQHKI